MDDRAPLTGIGDRRGGSVDPRLSVIIAGYNRREYLEKALDSIGASSVRPREVIYVDGGSTDGTLEMLRSRPQVTVVEGNLEGVARNRNLGARVAEGECLVFLDDDATVLPFTLAETARLFEHEEVGAVGAPLRGTSAGENQFPGNRFLHPWFVPVPGPAGPGVSSAPRTVQGRGAYLAVRRSLFQELNGFDRCLYPYGGEDFDLCWKVWMSGSEVALIEGAVLHRGFGDNPKLVPAERIARNLSDNVANYLMIYLKNSSRTTLVQFPLIAGWILSFPVRCGASRASVLGVRKAFRRIEESGGLTKLRRESQRVRARTDLGITRLFRGAGQGRSGALGGRR